MGNPPEKSVLGGCGSWEATGYQDSPDLVAPSNPSSTIHTSVGLCMWHLPPGGEGARRQAQSVNTFQPSLECICYSFSGPRAFIRPSSKSWEKKKDFIEWVELPQCDYSVSVTAGWDG